MIKGSSRGSQHVDGPRPGKFVCLDFAEHAFAAFVNAQEHESFASVAQVGIHMPTVVDVHVDRGRCTALWLAKVLDTSH